MTDPRRRRRAVAVALVPATAGVFGLTLAWAQANDPLAATGATPVATEPVAAPELSPEQVAAVTAQVTALQARIAALQATLAARVADAEVQDPAAAVSAPAAAPAAPPAPAAAPALPAPRPAPPPADVVTGASG